MNITRIVNLIISVLFIVSCTYNPASSYEWIKKDLNVARVQLKTLAKAAEHTGMLPRSTWRSYDMDFLLRQLEKDTTAFSDSLSPQPDESKVGRLRLCPVDDWTSGFFPGTLWYAYEMTGDETLKEEAMKYTKMLEPVRNITSTHDLGFMINCSYGNAYRLNPDAALSAVLIEASENLYARFDSRIGCIRSWDFGDWNYPVIIDNMMNLDLLFTASKLTGNNKYRDVAITHARTTMKNHFRPDYSSYHLVSFNNDGTVERKQTHQGKNDESAWARGQAWAVYGFASCYRETGDKKYLEMARHIAGMIMYRVQTDDLIPFWDYDAPNLPETPRDVSAAAVTASALIELSTMVEDGGDYFNYAELILKHLSGSKYLAEPGENEGFILKHSTGSLPNGSEIDTPINYADYYFMEALKRYMDVKEITMKNPV